MGFRGLLQANTDRGDPGGVGLSEVAGPLKGILIPASKLVMRCMFMVAPVHADGKAPDAMSPQSQTEPKRHYGAVQTHVQFRGPSWQSS